MVHRSVDSPHYHVWTDALHGRHLAQQAKNAWDRGTYVRWTIMSAWSVFELAAGDALSIGRIGDRPIEKIEEKLDALGLEPLDKGRGIWQQVLVLRARRVDYLHRIADQERLFAPTEEAIHAVGTVRDAVKDLHLRIGTAPPEWIDDDSNPKLPSGNAGNLTVIRAGADRSDPNAIRVTFVFAGDEKESEVLPPGTDPVPIMNDLIRSIQMPISAVRAYRGTELIEETELRMRGS